MMSCGYSRFARRGWHGFGMMSPTRQIFWSRRGEARATVFADGGACARLRVDEAAQGGAQGGVYRASAGTVYPTLQQLEDEGLITFELREGKKVYRLTDEGRRELEEREEVVQEIWRRARRWEDWRGAFNPDASEIRGPAERLVKAAFRAVAGERASERRVERVREILQHALRELEELGRPR